MEKWKYDLIARVTSSKAFPARTQAPAYRRVLVHLAEHSAGDDSHSRRGTRLQTKFELKTGGSNAVKRLALLLKKYFKTVEGRQLPRQIEIVYGRNVDPSERYTVRFPLNKRALGWVFWKPHMEQKYSTFIAYGLPLFLTDKNHRVFTRYFNVNDADKVKLRKLKGEIARPFVAAGDLLAAIACSRWLAEQQVTVDYKSFKAEDGMKALENATDLHSNVIAVGSKRVNGILNLYQCGKLRNAERQYLPFRLDVDYVAEVNGDGRRTGVRYKDKRRNKITSVPVVITRRVGIRHVANAVTLIASNHGRAVARAAELLTTEDDLEKLFEDPHLQPWLKALPPNFQILLRVEVPADEETAGDFDVVDAWPRDT
jgi:hypothetical protein